MTMLDHRVVGRISIFLLVVVVDISFGARGTSCNDPGLPGELIVQFRGASCTANTRKSCVGDRCFEDDEMLPIDLFKGSQPGTRAPVIAYQEAYWESFYTVLMLDPDAPNPNDPTSAPWLHWMVVNILGRNLLSDDFEGDTKKLYAPPTPPSGVHTYDFMLYRQPGYLRTVQTPTSRARFDVEAFEGQFGLEGVARISFITGQEITM